jgi:ribosomal 50S subunit-associated protein YjgA (DUF615 family)
MTLINSSNSSGTTYKRTLQEQQRISVEMAKRLQQKLKQQIKDKSVNAVKTYNEYIRSLRTVNDVEVTTPDWHSFAAEPHPKLPVKEATHQLEAEYNLNAYVPKWIDYLTWQHRKKITDLSDRIAAARLEDDLVYNAKLKQFRNDVSDWKQVQSITKGMTERDPETYQYALDFFNPFAAILCAGLQIKCECYREHLIVQIQLDAGKVIPAFTLSKTAKGKLLNTDMPANDYNQLLKDFVCGCVLRVARETLAILPVDFVIVNVDAQLMNKVQSSTAHRSILSVRYNRKDFVKQYVQKAMPVISIANIPHRIAYSDQEGFLPVEVLTV